MHVEKNLIFILMLFAVACAKEYNYNLRTNIFNK